MIERSPDPLDAARDYAQRSIDMALDHHRARAGQTDKPLLIEGLECCRECAEVIPLARLRASPDAARCVECQAIEDKQRSRCR